MIVSGHFRFRHKITWFPVNSYAEEAEPYAEALRDANRIQPPKTISMAEYLAQPDRNPTAVSIYYERLARDYQTQADLLKAKADACWRASRSGEP